MKLIIAEWSSRGGKWFARLCYTADGYRLAEYKNGQEVGASFRNRKLLKTDAEAIAYYHEYVKNSFDVEMKRA